MKWKANPEFLKPRYFEIEHDPAVGFYLYVFVEGKYDGKYIDNYLQDTLKIAMEQARDDLGVPLDAWIKVEE